MGFFSRLGGTGGYEAQKQAMDDEFPNMTIREANEFRQKRDEDIRVGLNTGTAHTADSRLIQGREDADKHAKDQRNAQKIAEYNRQLALAHQTRTTPPTMPALE